MSCLPHGAGTVYFSRMRVAIGKIRLKERLPRALRALAMTEQGVIASRSEAKAKQSLIVLPPCHCEESTYGGRRSNLVIMSVIASPPVSGEAIFLRNK
jgi:hypothetical protein